MVLTTLTNKGQVTIPKNVRESLGLNTGDKIEFIIDKNGEVRIKPVTKKVDDVFGILHKQDRWPVATENMDIAVRQKIKEKFE